MRVEMNLSHLSIQHYLQGDHREPDVTESPLDTKDKFVAFVNTARGQQKPSSGQISSIFVKCMLGYRKKMGDQEPVLIRVPMKCEWIEENLVQEPQLASSKENSGAGEIDIVLAIGVK